MPKKNRKLSPEEEEKVIEFVKSNEILYNVRHKMFRDCEAKNRLWLQLATEMNVDVEFVKRKWVVMRDYFIHSKGKKTTGSAASRALSKRDDALTFLMQTSIVNRPTISSLPPINEQTESYTMNDADMADDSLNGSKRYRSSDSLCQEILSPSEKSSVKASRTCPQTETNEILRDFLKQRPKATEFQHQKNEDAVQLFFNAMASTVRKLSPVSIARIKMKVANIVGEEELSWAENNAEQSVKYIY